jgi:uncharacterized protein (TIGR02246 family)
MGTEKTLLALEDEMWRANRAGDGAFYAHLLRDDALVVSRYGVAGKEQIVPVIDKNDNPYLRTDLSNQRVLRITDDSALVTYEAAVTALVNGAEVSFRVLATSVYAYDGQRWRGVFHQQTAL